MGKILIYWSFTQFFKNCVFYVNLAHDKNLSEGCLAKLKILLKEVTNQSNASVNILCKYYFVVDDAGKIDISEEESLIADYWRP